jgi:hypothetical protein
MAALVRLVLSRFCYVAVLGILFCQTPKAVGVASVQVWPPRSEALQSPKRKAENLAAELPQFTHVGRQVSVRVASGILSATVSWAVDDETSLDVLRGRIEYRPDADSGGSCPNIRFIQIAKAERSGGLDYEWQGLEKHRNVLRTSSQMGDGIKPGYFVDHRASACVPGELCSPYFRDYWANARESRDGLQLGGRFAPASLVDYPFGWDILEQISFESCARCVESGEFLGCADWGARWPAQGRRSIASIQVRETPSRTFLAALRRFEEFYRGSELSPNSSHLRSR